jgi:hypothetical protein
MSPVRKDKSVETSATVAADGDRNVRKAVRLFVVDAPSFQSDPDVLDARPADILEVLSDARSSANTAGHSDAEIVRMPSGDAQPNR